MPNYRIKVSDRDGENIKTIEFVADTEKRAREIAYGRDYLILEIDEIYDDSAPTPTQRIQTAVQQSQQSEGFGNDTEYRKMRTAVFWGIMHAWIVISVATLCIWYLYYIISSVYESTNSSSYY